MKYAVYTSCNLYYLDRALVLANTLKKYNHNVDFYIFLSDYVDKEFFQNKIFCNLDYIIDPCDVGIPNFVNWCFQYDVIEMCTAVKGYCLKYLLNKGYDSVIYLDPDIACFSSLDPLYTELESHSILLTPHQLFPAKTAASLIDHELAAHKYGIYNLGFLGVSNCKEGNSFANWWSIRLRDYCLDDIPNGMFTDQKWCDAVPSFFPNTKVIRHPGCNVASWNLAERTIKINSNGIWINDEWPLVFYHFTKYFKEGISQTQNYAQSVDSISVWNWYGREIKALRSIMPEPSSTNKYDHYLNGSLITKDDRRNYRKSKNIFHDNPFEGHNTT